MNEITIVIQLSIDEAENVLKQNKLRKVLISTGMDRLKIEDTLLSKCEIEINKLLNNLKIQGTKNEKTN